MTTESDLGPPPIRMSVDEATVRRLIEDQFPAWDGLPVRRVEAEGWDNRTFRLGDAMVARLPSAEPYALAVEKEQRWLPVLAPRLPLPIPVPLAHGKPNRDYPYAWSVHTWLPGAPADRAAIADPDRFARDLALFLRALQRVETEDGPKPGLHNWYRGGSLTRFQGEVERGLAVLDGERAERVRELWRSALAAPWNGPDVWFHGDVAVGNLLVREGVLAAVIDFGTTGVGDPACDLAIAWTFFEPDSRKVFLETLDADPSTVARASGWALWKTLAGYANDVEGGVAVRPEAAFALDQLLSDPGLEAGARLRAPAHGHRPGACR